MTLIYYEEVKNSVFESSLENKEEKEALFCGTCEREYTLINNLESACASFQNIFDVSFGVVCAQDNQCNSI